MQIERDFLGEPFVNFKCSRCRKEYRAMSMSLGTRTCPICSNPPEVTVPTPEDILAALEHSRKDDE